MRMCGDAELLAHNTPLACPHPLAALLGGCECRCSNTDASIIVADVAPAGDSFQAVCRRREAATGQAADKWRESGKTMLKLLGLSK
jgi:hypothetical protein